MKFTSVWSILQDRYGKLWFGTSDGVYCYEDGIFSHFSSDLRCENKEQLELRAIYHLLEDKKGNIWFATYSGDGLCRFDGKTLTRINPKEYTSIEKLIEDKDGNIWFNSAQKGICRYDGKTYSENITKEEKLGWSQMLYDSKKNQIWFTRKESICCYDGAKTTVLNAFINGLPNKDLFPIFHDKDGYNWFAVQKMGLYRYDGKIFEKFSE